MAFADPYPLCGGYFRQRAEDTVEWVGRSIEISSI
jgi:hypothetical protein